MNLEAVKTGTLAMMRAANPHARDADILASQAYRDWIRWLEWCAERPPVSPVSIPKLDGSTAHLEVTRLCGRCGLAFHAGYSHAPALLSRFCEECSDYLF